MSLAKTSESFTPDNLFAGHVQPVVADEVTIASGAGVLARGTVLGRVTSTGKCVAVNTATEGASAGSGVVYAVLAETVDATSADVKAPAYFTGEYNINALTFGGTDDAADHEVNARKVGIFFKDTISA